MAERRRLQILPELGISDADQRKIGLVINPGNFSDEPLAAATLLQANECAIEQLIGGGQDLTVAYHRAGFVGFAGAFAPGLIVVVLLASNFNVDDGTLPRGQRRTGF